MGKKQSQAVFDLDLEKNISDEQDQIQLIAFNHMDTEFVPIIDQQTNCNIKSDDFSYQSPYENIWSGLITKISYQITVGGLWIPHFVIREDFGNEYWVPIFDKVSFTISKEKYCFRCGKIWNAPVIIKEFPLDEQNSIDSPLLNINESEINIANRNMKNFQQHEYPLPPKPICQSCTQDLNKERENLKHICSEIFKKPSETEHFLSSAGSEHIISGNCGYCEELERCLKDHVIIIGLFEEFPFNLEKVPILALATLDQLNLIQRTWGASRLIVIWPQQGLFGKKNVINVMINLVTSKNSPIHQQLSSDLNEWKLRLFYGEGIRLVNIIPNIGNDFNSMNLKNEAKRSSKLNKNIVDLRNGERLAGELFSFLQNEKNIFKDWNVAIGSAEEMDVFDFYKGQNQFNSQVSQHNSILLLPHLMESPGWSIEGWCSYNKAMWIYLSDGQINAWNQLAGVRFLHHSFENSFLSKKSIDPASEWHGSGWIHLEQLIGRWILL